MRENRYIFLECLLEFTNEVIRVWCFLFCKLIDSISLKDIGLFRLCEFGQTLSFKAIGAFRGGYQIFVCKVVLLVFLQYPFNVSGICSDVSSLITDYLCFLSFSLSNID